MNIYLLNVFKVLKILLRCKRIKEDDVEPNETIVEETNKKTSYLRYIWISISIRELKKRLLFKLSKIKRPLKSKIAEFKIVRILAFFFERQIGIIFWFLESSYLKTYNKWMGQTLYPKKCVKGTLIFWPDIQFLFYKAFGRVECDY